MTCSHIFVNFVSKCCDKCLIGTYELQYKTRIVFNYNNRNKLPPPGLQPLFFRFLRWSPQPQAVLFLNSLHLLNKQTSYCNSIKGTEVGTLQIIHSFLLHSVLYFFKFRIMISHKIKCIFSLSPTHKCSFLDWNCGKKGKIIIVTIS